MKTTDNANELFDIVDEKDNIISQARRGEVHKDKKLIHRSIGVAVFNKKGEMYLQKRSETKDTDPGKWTISCSGHVMSAGPVPRSDHPQDIIYEEAAHRELFEELGIGNLELEFVAKYICRAPNETEIQTLYKTIYDGPFKLNKQEITRGKFFTRKELVELVQLGKLELSFMGKAALGKLGWLSNKVTK